MQAPARRRLRRAVLASVRTPCHAGWRARRRRHYAAAARRGSGPTPVRAVVAFPTEPAAAAAHLLASVVHFLSTHKNVQSLTLLHGSTGDAVAGPRDGAEDGGRIEADEVGCEAVGGADGDSVSGGGIGGDTNGGGAGAIEAARDVQDGGSEDGADEEDSDGSDEDSGIGLCPPGDIDINVRFFLRLVPLLERLPLTHLCVPDMVLDMWRKAHTHLALSAVPLRRLQVINLLRGASWVSVAYALRDFKTTLEGLTLGDEDFRAERAPDSALRAWLPSSVMPRLTSLTLVNLNVDATAAARMAVACPTLTHLDVRGNWKAGVGSALRIPAALPALTHVTWRAGGTRKTC
eukprot:TRINITY_DN4913_c0_g1_i2.p1 TRINITY_DN4913_c0_g1~~TRINITY_DN4913_c0_g1_i2.p1  ORF type:complete len:348 (-),score=51.76 TRINITY_DN4913_c0_g1_i2:1372-2415(-)